MVKISTMKPPGNLLAWINRCKTDRFVAALIGEGAVPGAYKDFPGRLPAMQSCSSQQEARQWIEAQAAALDLPVKWVSEIPEGYVPQH
jgi:hypothetical protein